MMLLDDDKFFISILGLMMDSVRWVWLCDGDDGDEGDEDLVLVVC